jgi:hypothetical protein
MMEAARRNEIIILCGVRTQTQHENLERKKKYMDFGICSGDIASQKLETDFLQLLRGYSIIKIMRGLYI